jgi:hypothetical protein
MAPARRVPKKKCRRDKRSIAIPVSSSIPFERS